MRVLLLLRGAPGVGKTTWIEQNGLTPYALSADGLRLLCSAPRLSVSGSVEVDVKNDGFVWDILFDILERRMQNGEFTVIDATNSKTAEMNRYKALCDKYRYRMYCVDFTGVPMDVVKERNRQRPEVKRVPDYAIERMYARFATQKIPSGITVIQPDELDKVWLKCIDLSQYSKVKPACLGGLLVPRLLVERAFREVEGRDIPVPLLVHVLAATERHDGVCHRVDGCHLFLALLLFRRSENRVFDLNTEPRTVLQKLENTQVAALFDGSLQVVDPALGSERYALRVAVAMDGIHIVRRVLHEGLADDLEVVVVTDAVDHLVCSDLGQVVRQSAQTGVSYQICVALVGKVRALAEPAVQTAHILLVDAGLRQLRGCDKLELTGLGYLVVRPRPQPAFVVAFQKQDVRALADFHQEQNDLHVLQPTVDVIAAEDVELVVLDAALAVKVVPQNREAPVDITNAVYINVPKQKVVARAYDKFFNINEREETKLEALEFKLQFPVTAYVKENGFLGIVSYNDEDDSLFITTKSSPDGDYAKWFRELFEKTVSEHNREKIKNFVKASNVSMVFECVDMEHDPHIIDYGTSRLFLLDIVHNEMTCRKFDYESLQNAAKNFGLQAKELAYVIEDWPSFFDWYNAVLDEGYLYNGRHIEGFVIEDQNGYMVKLKLAYYNFWKYMRGIAHETIRRCALDGRKTATLTNALSNHFYGWIRGYRAEHEPSEIPTDICTLRKMFFETDEGKPFAATGGL